MLAMLSHVMHVRIKLSHIRHVRACSGRYIRVVRYVISDLLPGLACGCINPTYLISLRVRHACYGWVRVRIRFSVRFKVSGPNVYG